MRELDFRTVLGRHALSRRTKGLAEVRRRMVEAVARARAELLDAAGLGLLASSAFCWSTAAGLAAAGVGTLVLNWRIEKAE